MKGGGRERKRGKERNADLFAFPLITHSLVDILVCALTRDHTHNLGVLGWHSNQLTPGQGTLAFLLLFKQEKHSPSSRPLNLLSFCPECPSPQNPHSSLHPLLPPSSTISDLHTSFSLSLLFPARLLLGTLCILFIYLFIDCVFFLYVRLLCPHLHPQLIEQCLAHSRYSINLCWMNELCTKMTMILKKDVQSCAKKFPNGPFKWMLSLVTLRKDSVNTCFHKDFQL